MSKQILYLLFTVLLLGLFASAAPVPLEGAVVKKGLKQLKLKRGDPNPLLKRDDVKPKPSGYPAKRQEAGYPKPSGYFNKV
ncbi:hypothetical protein MPER_06403 [Moniliophthora perniciosa FA553]|nr:hypothetical protein MPER_06403 [Moniliophthora perniciosa FA553]